MTPTKYFCHNHCTLVNFVFQSNEVHLLVKIRILKYFYPYDLEKPGAAVCTWIAYKILNSLNKPGDIAQKVPNLRLGLDDRSVGRPRDHGADRLLLDQLGTGAQHSDRRRGRAHAGSE
jgi:hypothetical protein